MCAVIPQYCVYRFRLSGNSFLDYLKRYQFFISHVSNSPILSATVSAQHFFCDLSNSCNVRTICRLFHHDKLVSVNGIGALLFHVGILHGAFAFPIERPCDNAVIAQVGRPCAGEGVLAASTGGQTQNHRERQKKRQSLAWGTPFLPTLWVSARFMAAVRPRSRMNS